MSVIDVKIESGWKQALASEFASPYFATLTQRVKTAYNAAPGMIYPPGKLIFEAFNQTPFDTVRVVILGQDPYHGPGQAHGLCFSVNEGVKHPPSLVNIFQEIKAETGKEVPASGNLTRWAQQGVLLLNSILTVEQSQPLSHQGWGWETFTDAAISALVRKKTGVIFLLWGAPAQKKAHYIDISKHIVLKAPHPSPLSAHRGFFGCGHFNQVNEILTARGEKAIEW